MAPVPLLLTLPAQLLAPAAPAALPVEVRDRVEAACRAELEALLERDAFPGASLAVVLPDESVVTVAVGVASLDTGKPLDPQDRMLAGSVGKTFVSALAQRLAEEGTLDLDARLATFLGNEEWFAGVPNGAQVTLRQLLRHTSGVPRYVFEAAFWEALLASPDRIWCPEELVAYVSGHAPLFAPDEGWAYADTNYLLVGLACERAGVPDVDAAIRERFLEPLGLADTIPSDARELPGVVQGHVTASRALGVPERVMEDGRFVFNPQFEGCGGGYASTTGDLARWARALFSGAVLEPASMAGLLETVPAEPLGPGLRYGLGVMVEETELGPLVGHDGFMPGYLTSMGWFPEVRVAVAFQTNTDDLARLGERLRGILVRVAAAARGELSGRPVGR